MLVAPKCSCSQYMTPTLVDASDFGRPPQYVIEWECVHREVQMQFNEGINKGNNQ